MEAESCVWGDVSAVWTHRGSARYDRRTVDPAVPGTIDGQGRFRLRFKVESKDDLIVTGQVVSGSRDLGNDVLIASGGVIGTLYGGRTFQLWHEAQY